MVSWVLWIKALHVLAVISWMAGMLYLPRLFVYHVSATGETSETFKTMERRLLKAIMTPAMIVTWLTGLYLAYAEGFFRDVINSATPSLIENSWPRRIKRKTPPPAKAARSSSIQGSMRLGR
jgi:uncharacterized membrane protein